ncbi:MAG: hypothetical protein ABIB11_04880, partial [Candidatus Omnitrophota bacterium]
MWGYNTYFLKLFNNQKTKYCVLLFCLFLFGVIFLLNPAYCNDSNNNFPEEPIVDEDIFDELELFA